MAAPSIPNSFLVQQANLQVLLIWNNVPNATSYPVWRSLDNVTFIQIAAPVTNTYTDTTVTRGVQYFYQIGATNVSGTSPLTSSQGIVPTGSGEMTLGQIRLAAQQRADLVNSGFVTTAEWNSYITQSMFELYDLLVVAYQDYYLAPLALFLTNGNNNAYPLPDGIQTFLDPAGNSFVPKPFYKMNGVDVGLSNNNNAWFTVQKFNWNDRNNFVYPQLNSTILGVFNMQYRVMGSNLEFIPVPSANQYVRLWYIPRLIQPLADTDILDGISGWTEYVIIDAAIKAMQKEESDVTALGIQKGDIIKRIEDAAGNRDVGSADTVNNNRSIGSRFGTGGGTGSNGGGFVGFAISLLSLSFTLLHAIARIH